MTPRLVRLPEAVLDGDGLHDLWRAASLVARGRTVLVGPQRDAEGDALDPFVVAAALASRGPGPSLGVAVAVGAARAGPLVARETAAAVQLGACDALLLLGPPSVCRDAAVAIAARLGEGPGAVDPPPLRWREGATLLGVVDGAAVQLGAAVDAELTAEVTTADAPLVELVHPVVPARALAAALAR